MGLCCLIQYNHLYFHSFTCKFHDFITFCLINHLLKDILDVSVSLILRIGNEHCWAGVCEVGWVFWDMQRNGRSWSHGRFIFRFWRIFYTDIRSGWTNLHYHQQRMMVPLSIQSYQHLLPVVMLTLAIQTGWDEIS